MYRTRKEFLVRLQDLAGLKSQEEADRIAQVVIGLIKAGISPEASEAVAASVGPDLAEGWRNIALPDEALEFQEMMSELEEVREEPRARREDVPPEYG
jgi:uncharacterized protein (DUF2267 family)